MQPLIKKLNDRNLWRSLLAYPAAAFVILQAVEFFIANYGLNPKLLTLSLILLIGGFFVTLIWNWNHGEKGVQLFTRKEIATYGVISSVTIISAILFWTRTETLDYNVKKTEEKPYNTLAVLPFTNSSLDGSLLYLSDGIPENLINRLSTLTNLNVLSRNSTFALDSSERNAETLKKKLKADIMLSGQLDVFEDQLVVNCQLVDVANNNQMWGNKIYYNNSNIVKLEDSIVSSLLIPLQKSLTHETNEIQQNRDIDPEAYTHFLKGRHLSYGSTSEEAEKALDHFRKAIELEPSYTEAYTAIANEKIVQAMFSTATRKEIFNEARIAVQTALSQEPNSSDAHMLDGSIKFYGNFDWSGAEKSYKKAIEENPKNANAYVRYSAYLVALKKYEESILMAKKAIELDPISISSLHNLGWVNLVSKNYEASEKAFDEALALYPDWTWGYVKRGYARLFLEKCDLAQQDAKQAKQLVGEWGSELLQVAMVFIYKGCGNSEKASELLTAFFDRVNDENYKDAFSVFYAYYLGGNIEKSLDWAEKAVEEKTPGAYQFNLDIFYPYDLTTHPRFIKIRKSMNF